MGERQASTNPNLPAQLQAIDRYVLTHAFVEAMHPTLVLPVAPLVVAAVAANFVRASRPAHVPVGRASGGRGLIWIRGGPKAR